MSLFPTLNKEEQNLLTKIAKRAHKIFIEEDIPRTFMALEMDVAATHKSCPLDLNKLANFSDGDFRHDVVGIVRHLDRDTGKLLHGFLPRAAQPEGLTDKDITKYIDYTLNQGNSHVRCELEWLIDNVPSSVQDTIKDIAEDETVTSRKAGSHG